MHRLLLCLLFVFFCPPLSALSLADYLPDSQAYDPEVPTPRSSLGFEVGQRHVRPDQLVRYMERLAESSPRARLERIGETHEQRPQVTLTLTHPDNYANLDALLARHINDEPEAPLVLWFGYSVHGNEASGSNAAMVFAYHLAAAQDQALDALLANTIILIDPSLNPDGLGRFSQWVNSHRSRHPVADRSDREHQEVWPGGRFNHYWFDLNRDWLLLTHPESRARVGFQQKWRPHVITDFHEMGSDSTYFFQPGVPERRHPLTPETNVVLTAKLANYHADALNRIGQLYFTEERFDDFYYGKGSTYPDVQGSIGILFEQASVRGHLADTAQGERSFAIAVRNQVATSMSTLEGAHALREELQTYRRDFYQDAAGEARQDAAQFHVFGDSRDPIRGRALADIFKAHGITVNELARPVETEGQRFQPGSAWVIAAQQRQYRLLSAMLERRTEFVDSTFYDVSAWTMPLAFDLPVASSRRDQDWAGDALATTQAAAPIPPNDAYAYAFDWDYYSAPRALQRLLAAELKPRVATRPFTAMTASGERRFELGAIVIPGRHDAARLAPILAQISREDRLPVHALSSGLTPQGIDLGSPSLPPLKPVKPLLVVGNGVSASEAGEVWHLLDTRLGLPPVMVDTHRLKQVSLADYSHVLMVDGNYQGVDTAWVDSLKQWVKQGGVLVASKRAAAWATKLGLHRSKPKREEEKKAEESESGQNGEKPPRRYGDYDKDFSQSVIGGVIVEASVDTTHPLSYGYRRDRLALFRNGTVFLQPSENPYETPLRYTEMPVLSGFLGAERQQQLHNSAAVTASKVGRGAVVRMADNPNFRGYWYGTNRLYFNAIFLAQTLKATPTPKFPKHEP